jgi:hypothetical protein
MRVIGFSVEQLTKNSLIVMVCGISRMKSRKRGPLSVSYVLMKSLSSVSTTEFGRFSWLVVQQHSQRCEILWNFPYEFQTLDIYFNYCTPFKMSVFSDGYRRKGVCLHAACSYVYGCVHACVRCFLYFRVVIILHTKFCPRCWVHAGVIYHAW